jgi:CubicO group peptidase (beta-lactamase class C family)
MKQPPVVIPGTSPVYSNDAFQILGYVVESITGKPFETTLSTRILAPLGMNQTTLSTPQKHTAGVIPVNKTASGWATDYGDETPYVRFPNISRIISLNQNNSSFI